MSGHSWNTEDEFNANIMGRDFDISYHTKGYYCDSTYYSPAEGDGETDNIEVTWINFGDGEHTIIQNDRNWKRLRRFCPKFIDAIEDAVNDHDADQDRRD